MHLEIIFKSTRSPDKLSTFSTQASSLLNELPLLSALLAHGSLNLLVQISILGSPLRECLLFSCEYFRSLDFAVASQTIVMFSLSLGTYASKIPTAERASTSFAISKYSG